VCSRLRLRDFERLLRLTESFTWEDQPTRDPHTGHRTLVGWIPHLQKMSKYFFAFTAFYHLVQSGIRMYVSHELMYSAWYPFDTVSSPGYELVILLQVIPYFFTACISLITFPPSESNRRETKVSFIKNQIVIALNKVKLYLKLKLKLIPVARNKTQDIQTSIKSMDI
jgi:hypothetical protein